MTISIEELMERAAVNLIHAEVVKDNGDEIEVEA